MACVASGGDGGGDGGGGGGGRKPIPLIDLDPEGGGGDDDEEEEDEEEEARPVPRKEAGPGPRRRLPGIIDIRRCKRCGRRAYLRKGWCLNLSCAEALACFAPGDQEGSPLN